MHDLRQAVGVVIILVTVVICALLFIAVTAVGSRNQPQWNEDDE